MAQIPATGTKNNTDQTLLDKSAANDQASFKRSMALIELQRKQQEQTQLFATLSAMVKNEDTGKMSIIRNLKTG